MKIQINKQSSIKIISNKIIYFDPFMIDEENHDADIVFSLGFNTTTFSPPNKLYILSGITKTVSSFSIFLISSMEK